MPQQTHGIHLLEALCYRLISPTLALLLLEQRVIDFYDFGLRLHSSKFYNKHLFFIVDEVPMMRLSGNVLFVI
jgi:hypothetical protein